MQVSTFSAKLLKDSINNAINCTRKSPTRNSKVYKK